MQIVEKKNGILGLDGAIPSIKLSTYRRRLGAGAEVSPLFI